MLHVPESARKNIMPFARQAQDTLNIVIPYFSHLPRDPDQILDHWDDLDSLRSVRLSAKHCNAILDGTARAYNRFGENAVHLPKNFRARLHKKFGLWQGFAERRLLTADKRTLSSWLHGLRILQFLPAGKFMTDLSARVMDVVSEVPNANDAHFVARAGRQMAGLGYIPPQPTLSKWLDYIEKCTTSVNCAYVAPDFLWTLAVWHAMSDQDKPTRRIIKPVANKVHLRLESVPEDHQWANEELGELRDACLWFDKENPYPQPSNHNTKSSLERDFRVAFMQAGIRMKRSATKNEIMGKRADFAVLTDDGRIVIVEADGETHGVLRDDGTEHHDGNSILQARLFCKFHPHVAHVRVPAPVFNAAISNLSDFGAQMKRLFRSVADEAAHASVNMPFVLRFEGQEISCVPLRR